MAREATFNFTPESTIPSRKEKKAHTHWASVSRKYNTIRFSPSYVKDKKLNGKFIKMYFDKQKQSIAWRVMHENSFEGLAGHRKVMLVTRKAGKYETEVCSLGIKVILDELGLKPNASFSKLSISQYRPQAMLEDPFDYVQLK